MVNRVSNVNVGRQRSQAIYRLLAAIILFTVGWTVYGVLAFVSIVAGLIFLVVDLILGIFRDDSWTSGGRLRSWSVRLFAWPFDILFWIFLGKTTSGSASFPWLPEQSHG